MPTFKQRLDDAEGDVNRALQIVESLVDEMQERFDDLTEKEQEGEKGEDLQGRIDALQEIADTLEGIEWGIEE